MSILQVYVDDRTLASLQAYAKDNGRTIEDLAEAAIAEAALAAEVVSARTKPCTATAEDIAFLARFVGRGWLAFPRATDAEQAAVDVGLRNRWLRREGPGEVQFTPEGRTALAEGKAPLVETGKAQP